MTYTATFAATEFTPHTETAYPDLPSAVQGTIEAVNGHPEILIGREDLAVITDDDEALNVVALFREGDEFILARESIEPKYREAIDSMDTEVLSDHDTYVLFARWPAMDQNG